MNQLSRRLVETWVSWGPRFMPFADVATAELPLSRLLRLSLFQVSVGMVLVLLVGTLNRVMIVELGVPASVVGLMLALPLLFAPFRALIGHRSDTHRSALGWRRVPYIWQGTLLQFGGLAMMPFALLVLSGGGQAGDAPAWIGRAAAALSFLLVGAGVHVTQTVGLALATDLAPTQSQPRVVGLMYVMLLLGTIGSAILFGAVLADFSAGRLVSVIQGTAVAVVVLNVLALWKQEARRPDRARRQADPDPTFAEAWAAFSRSGRPTRRLLAIGIGTAGFGMADILIEPYGGQVLHLSVGATTTLTAVLASGSLIGFGLASQMLGRGGDPLRLAALGLVLGLPAFGCVLLAAPLGSAHLFGAGNFLLGMGAALFGHGTLTATMRLAPAAQVGMALGAWGAVQATAAGLGVAAAGVMRDLASVSDTGGGGLVGGYSTVYCTEVALLVVTLLLLLPLLRSGGRRPSPKPEFAAPGALP